jgi:hypothetical protein
LHCQHTYSGPPDVLVVIAGTLEPLASTTILLTAWVTLFIVRFLQDSQEHEHEAQPQRTQQQQPLHCSPLTCLTACSHVQPVV